MLQLKHAIAPAVEARRSWVLGNASYRKQTLAIHSALYRAGRIIHDFRQSFRVW